jgi:hypothetical protein
MITAVVGRTFLTAFNARHKSNLSPKDFFEKHYWELFYNHPKYMQWVTNSPFVQMRGDQKVDSLSAPERLEKLADLHEKAINEISDANASFALGFPASETKEYASTSGLVSDLSIPVESDDIYLSWIGSGLGIGVAGGFTILFDDPIITLKTYDGWEVYRKYLNDLTLDKFRGNQINSWNGQWLTYSMGKDYKEDFDFATLQNQRIFEVDSSLIEINTVNWSRLFFSLSRQFPQAEMMGYVYSFGQTNKTIGFVPFQLKSGNRLKDIYKHLFGKSFPSSSAFEELFGMHIKRACELGSIGILALRPDNITKYMMTEKNTPFKNDEDIINYHAYKTWLIAMLSKNKEEITDHTLELAKTILAYRNDGTKNDRKNLIEKELFASSTKRAFIESLTKMVKDLDGESLLKIKDLKDEVHLMTNEEFGYFATLLKFDYAFLEKQS